MLAGAQAKNKGTSASIHISRGNSTHMIMAASTRKMGYQEECPNPVTVKVVTSLHKLLHRTPTSGNALAHLFMLAGVMLCTWLGL